MKTILIIAGLFNVFDAYAGNTTVHTVSAHLRTSGLNNFNPGIAYDFDAFRVGGFITAMKSFRFMR